DPGLWTLPDLMGISDEAGDSHRSLESASRFPQRPQALRVIVFQAELPGAQNSPEQGSTCDLWTACRTMKPSCTPPTGRQLRDAFGRTSCGWTALNCASVEAGDSRSADVAVEAGVDVNADFLISESPDGIYR